MHTVRILCILGTEADTVCVPVDSTSCYVCILLSIELLCIPELSTPVRVVLLILLASYYY